MPNYRFVFFGTPSIARTALGLLYDGGLVPGLIVTNPAKPQGRGMVLTHTPVASFGDEKGIEVITPTKIPPEVIEDLRSRGPWDFFVVVAYGKILPQALLDIPVGRVINIHPSLLPKYRGPSPMESVLLSDDTETGVTVMEIDALVDHGPIIAQESFELPKSTTLPELEEMSALVGSRLILNTIENYISGDLIPTPQNHGENTHTKKIQKSDGNLDGVEDSWDKWKKYRAYIGWPGVYFTAQRRGQDIRVKISKAHWDGDFIIDEVIPENQKPLPYNVFEKWLLD